MECCLSSAGHVANHVIRVREGIYSSALHVTQKRLGRRVRGNVNTRASCVLPLTQRSAVHVEPVSSWKAVQTQDAEVRWEETRLLSASPYSLLPELLKRHFFFPVLFLCQEKQNEKHRQGRDVRVLYCYFPSSSPRRSSVRKALGDASTASSTILNPILHGEHRTGGPPPGSSCHLPPGFSAMGPVGRHVLLNHLQSPPVVCLLRRRKAPPRLFL